MKQIMVFLSLFVFFACSEDDTVAPNGTPAKDSLAVVNPPSWSNGKIEGTWRMVNNEMPGYSEIPCLKDGQHGMMSGNSPMWKAIGIKRSGADIWYEVVDPWFRGYNDTKMRARLTIYSDRIEGYGMYDPGYGWGPLVHMVFNKM